MPLIATAKVKWDEDYQEKLGVETNAAKDLPDGVGLGNRQAMRSHVPGTVFHRLRANRSAAGRRRSGLRAGGQPQPELGYGEDFAESAEAAGISYEALLHRIITLGRSYKVAWRTDT